jgi:hypothetical protein
MAAEPEYVVTSIGVEFLTLAPAGLTSDITAIRFWGMLLLNRTGELSYELTPLGSATRELLFAIWARPAILLAGEQAAVFDEKMYTFAVRAGLICPRILCAKCEAEAAAARPECAVEAKRAVEADRDDNLDRVFNANYQKARRRGRRGGRRSRARGLGVAAPTVPAAPTGPAAPTVPAHEPPGGPALVWLWSDEPAED